MSEYLIQEETLKYLSSAVKEKAGIIEDMTPDEMARQIYFLETPTDTGTGSSGVIFYDYDGTVLYTYTVKEARALTALPELPIHDGVTSVGWTHSLEEVNAATKYLKVGAMYSSETTKLTIDLSLRSTTTHSVTIYYEQSNANGIKIHWGDGTSSTNSSAGKVNTSHTYSSIGGTNYIIELETISGTLKFGTYLSDNVSSTGLFGHYGSITCEGNKILTGLVIGNNLTMNDYSFTDCPNLTNVIISYGITKIPERCFFSAERLVFVVFPNTITSLRDQCMSRCESLVSAVIPESVTTMSSRTFYSNGVLNDIIIPSKVKSLPDSLFYACDNLKELYIRSETFVTGGYIMLDHTPTDLSIYVPMHILDVYRSDMGRWYKFRSQIKGEYVQYS